MWGRGSSRFGWASIHTFHSKTFVSHARLMDSCIWFVRLKQHVTSNEYPILKLESGISRKHKTVIVFISVLPSRPHTLWKLLISVQFVVVDSKLLKPYYSHRPEVSLITCQKKNIMPYQGTSCSSRLYKDTHPRTQLFKTVM